MWRKTDEEEKRLHGNIEQCKSIRKLAIHYTHITQNGVEVALRNLPDLETLESKYLCQALAEMHRNQLPASKYALTALLFGPADKYFHRESQFINGTLRLAASICPLVTKVVLHIHEGDPFNNEELLTLVALERLCEFRYQLRSSRRFSLKFHV